MIDPALSLGPDVNNENDGEPGSFADDHTDDNGIRFLTPIMPGQPVTIEVSAFISATAGTTVTVGAWLDLDNDGTFTPDEYFSIVLENPSNGGNLVTDTITFTAPADVGPEIYSRFRVAFDADEVGDPADYIGTATSGEVEDYVLMSLGNTVFFDTGDGTSDDGVYDSSNGETGIAGITLELYADGDVPGVDEPIATTTTDENGNYLFTGLPEGDYVVHIPASNFDPGEPLDGYLSSSGQTNDTGDEGSNENGVDDPLPSSNGISSGVVTLSPGGSPDASQDGNTANSDRTIDFGFVEFVPTAVELLSFKASKASDSSIKVYWVTGSEIDNFGFKIWRSETGDFSNGKQVHFETSSIVSGPGTAYTYIDSGLAEGTYTYWLIDVETTGTETIHGPVTFTLMRGYTQYLPVLIDGK